MKQRAVESAGKVVPCLPIRPIVFFQPSSRCLNLARRVEHLRVSVFSSLTKRKTKTRMKMFGLLAREPDLELKGIYETFVNKQRILQYSRRTKRVGLMQVAL